MPPNNSRLKGVKPRPNVGPITIRGDSVCSYCLIPLPPDKKTTLMAHPLWPYERMCKPCANAYARCFICDRKAVRWTVPSSDGDTRTYQVVKFTSDGRMYSTSDPQPLKNVEASALERLVCGRCSSMGLIIRQEDVDRELSFILEFMYLEFDVYFSPYLMRHQKGASKVFSPTEIAAKDPPGLYLFEDAKMYEKWLREHVNCIMKLIPLSVTMSSIKNESSALAYTDTCVKGTSRFISGIYIVAGLTRPKFWSVMVHELVHVYIHLLRKRDEPIVGCSNTSEEGLANALSQYTLKKVMDDVALSLGVDTDYLHSSKSTVPISLYDAFTPYFKQDFPSTNLKKYYGDDIIRHLLPQDNNLLYDSLHQEGLVISYLLRKEKNRPDESYGVAMRRCMKVVERRVESSYEPRKNVIHQLLIEFSDTGTIFKS